MQPLAERALQPAYDSPGHIPASWTKRRPVGQLGPIIDPKRPPKSVVGEATAEEADTLDEFHIKHDVGAGDESLVHGPSASFALALSSPRIRRIVFSA